MRWVRSRSWQALGSEGWAREQPRTTRKLSERRGSSFTLGVLQK
jgi:hypothetical protein